MKIICKNCSCEFDYSGRLIGKVQYMKCSYVFKVDYEANILCPECLNVIKPQNLNGTLIGTPFQEIAKKRKQEKNDGNLAASRRSPNKKALLSHVYEEVKNRLSIKSKDPIVIRGEKLSQNIVKAHIPRKPPEKNQDDVTKTVPDFKRPIQSTKCTESVKSDESSKKRFGLAKKLGLILLALALISSAVQILPDMMKGKFSYAIPEEHDLQAPVLTSSYMDAELKTGKNSIDLEELSKLFGENTQSIDNGNNGKPKIEIHKEKKAPKRNNKKSKTKNTSLKTGDRKFKTLIAKLNISSNYGYRKHPITNKRHFHTGIDIPRRYRSPIKALLSGKVVFSGYKRGYGNLVILRHQNGIKTYYGHNAKNTVLKGDHIRKGETVGYVGMTGNTTGPHLHFEVRKRNIPINPLNYLRKLLNKKIKITI